MHTPIISENQMRRDPDKSFTFVVPPMHGNPERLMEALYAIENYPLSTSDTVVFLGDNLGDGRNHKRIMSMLKTYRSMKPSLTFFLTGPSEHLFTRLNRKFMASKTGQNIMRSYRREVVDGNNTEKPAIPLIDVLSMQQDRRFLYNTHCGYSSDKYIISQGGVITTEKISFDKYPRELLIFGRDQFKKTDQVFDKLVVYAESPLCEKTVFKKGRVGLASNAVLVLDNKSNEPKVQELIPLTK